MNASAHNQIDSRIAVEFIPVTRKFTEDCFVDSEKILKLVYDKCKWTIRRFLHQESEYLGKTCDVSRNCPPKHSLRHLPEIFAKIWQRLAGNIEIQERFIGKCLSKQFGLAHTTSSCNHGEMR